MKHYYRYALHAAILLWSVLGFKVNAADDVVMTIDGNAIYTSEFTYLYGKNRIADNEPLSAREFASSFALFKMKVYEAEAAGYDTLPSFKRELASYCAELGEGDENLRREYRDGMLLFEITQRKVWHSSLLTAENLSAHFELNRSKFIWNEPRAKGWVLYGDDVRILASAREFLDKNPIEGGDIRVALKAEFGKNIFASKFIVRRGLNPMIDSLVFDGADLYEPGNGWKHAVAFGCRVIDTPEEWQDVKGELSDDYQNYLSRKWEEELWSSHTVEFNYEVIDAIPDV